MCPIETDLQLDTITELLAYIHDWHLTNSLESRSRIEWDCVMAPGVHYEEMDDVQHQWIDAASKADWYAMLRTPVTCEWNNAPGRFANSTRLRRGAQAENSIESNSSYTALHYAAWHGAPAEIVTALLELGASRGIRTADDKRQRPLDIARERGHEHLYDLLTPRGLPEVSDEELDQVEAHFHKLIVEESNGLFKTESLRFPDLNMLRDLPKIWMPVPRMYGGFNFWWDNGHLVTESFCRVCGGSGKTNHITPDGARLVDYGWG